MAIFKGAGVAIATPFHEDGSVNYEEFDRLIDYDIDGGADAIIVCGTTGESATMSEEEHMEVVKHCISYVNHRVPVIAGTGSNDTRAAIMLSQHAEADGADGLLLVTPYYNKATQKGLIAHYTAVAESVHTPCIMYNVPSRTGCNIQPATAAYLGKNVKNIVAIKAASGNISQIEETKALAGDNLDIYSGNDDQILPILACGGIGVISVLANVAPKETHDICQLFFDGNIAASRDLQYKALPLIHALFAEVNPIPVKEAINYIGITGGPLRLPLTTIEPEHATALRQAMIDFGIEVVG